MHPLKNRARSVPELAQAEIDLAAGGYMIFSGAWKGKVYYFQDGRGGESPPQRRLRRGGGLQVCIHKKGSSS